jgi:hypothetical protein
MSRLALLLPLELDMAAVSLDQSAGERSTEPVGILRWVFVRGAKALTCEVRTNGRHSHDVCVVPHWDVASSVVERYEGAAGALRRHAEVASYFRQAGWLLLRESPKPQVRRSVQPV